MPIDTLPTYHNFRISCPATRFKPPCCAVTKIQKWIRGCLRRFPWNGPRRTAVLRSKKPCLAVVIEKLCCGIGELYALPLGDFQRFPFASMDPGPSPKVPPQRAEGPSSRFLSKLDLQIIVMNRSIFAPAEFWVAVVVSVPGGSSTNCWLVQWAQAPTQLAARALRPVLQSEHSHSIVIRHFPCLFPLKKSVHVIHALASQPR